MEIPFATVKNIHLEIQYEMQKKFEEVYNKHWFIHGEEDREFEKEFAAFCNVEYCIGCGTGLDAISLILKAMGIGAGDEVIIPSNTFIATALAVSYAGAIPVLVEPNIETYTINPLKIEEKITKKDKSNHCGALIWQSSGYGSNFKHSSKISIKSNRRRSTSTWCYL